jgi:hypothetical protein
MEKLIFWCCFGGINVVVSIMELCSVTFIFWCCFGGINAIRA